MTDGKKVVVAGCVPQGKPDAEYIRGLSVVGVQQIDRVVEVVEETLKGNQVRLFGQKKVKATPEEEDSTAKAGFIFVRTIFVQKGKCSPFLELIPTL